MHLGPCDQCAPGLVGALWCTATGAFSYSWCAGHQAAFILPQGCGVVWGTCRTLLCHCCGRWLIEHCFLPPTTLLAAALSLFFLQGVLTVMCCCLAWLPQHTVLFNSELAALLGSGIPPIVIGYILREGQICVKHNRFLEAYCVHAQIWAE